MQLWEALISGAGLLLLLLAVYLIYRTVRFSIPHRSVEPAPDISVDTEEAVERLSGAIQYRTISAQNKSEFEGEQFQRMHSYLETCFPKVHETLGREVVNRYSLLYTWQGTDPEARPIMLTCHLDVVPVEPGTEQEWEYPPFSGAVTDEYIYGRGTMDVQEGVMAILEAVEYLIGQGFRPRRTVYIGFGHDEELEGEYGAMRIGELLRQRGVKLEYLLDEGLPIVDKLMEGIHTPVALVAVAEKGYLSLDLSTQGDGGHSSVPQGKTPAARLGRALHLLEDHPMPARLAGLVRYTFESIGPYMPWTYRIALANMWLFGPLIKKQLSGIPATNAALRTTTASTLFDSGIKENVLPTQAEAIVNFRIHPYDSVDKVVQHVRNVINDPDITIRKLVGFIEPSIVSDIQSRPYQQLERSIREVFPDVVVAPSLMVGATDARHYAHLTENIYRFIPLRGTETDLDRVHGTNERLSKSNYREMIRFYVRQLQNTAYDSHGSAHHHEKDEHAEA